MHLYININHPQENFSTSSEGPDQIVDNMELCDSEWYGC